MFLYDRIAKPLLFMFDAEKAHELSIAALKTGLPVGGRAVRSPRLAVTIAGLNLPNPLGMAAGYDKNAEVPDAILDLGFGFVECGTVTPKPQEGNPKPRLFRLIEDQAVVNRFGFNNAGHQAALARLQARKRTTGIVGINIGANKDSEDRIADYEAGVRIFAPHASYLTANISSPNTVGLRALQERESLAELLVRVMAARDQVAKEIGRKTPVFLKIAPDLTEESMVDIAEEVLEKKVDGLIVSNTTLSRDGLRSANSGEAGGMSGAPLFARSTAVLACMRKLVGHELPIIGVGGVDSAETALEKIRAGADVVQLYSSMVYAGPWQPAGIVNRMEDLLRAEGVESIKDIRDTRMDYWRVHPSIS